MENKLALDGGTPVKNTPFTTGKRYDERELAEIRDCFDHGSIIYWGGYKIGQFCETVKNYFGVDYCAGGSSGSAAIHAAVGAAMIEPGYEVITSPITDIGSLIGILYQNLIPVFADVDPHTYNMTPESIEKAITDRTRAVVVVHLAGNPCDMDGIMAVAKKHGLFVIEDCAQAYGARYKGRFAGTIGDVGAFSLNESKHLSSGDGGFIITNDKEVHGRCHNYMDKYYDRLGRGDRLEHLAPCYRASELQYAVAKAQFGKLDDLLAKRRKIAAILSEGLADIDGITLPKVLDGCESSWWFYMFRLTPGVFDGDGQKFAKAMCAEGCWAMAGYIPRPIYREKLFAEKSFFPGNVWPAEIISGRSYSYGAGSCPVAEEVLSTAIRLPVSEFFSEDDVKDMVKAVKKVAAGLRKQHNIRILTMSKFVEKFNNEQELENFLAQPSEALIDMMKRLDGDIMILGIAGKMGVTMGKTAVNAIKAAGVDKKVYGVARFSDAAARVKLEDAGVVTIPCDLLDHNAVAQLPKVKNVIFMAGRKFGTDGSEELTWMMNVIVPANVIEHFKDSRITAFSTGCVYPLVALDEIGCKESVTPLPVGEYSQSCLGRERVFEYGAKHNGTQVLLYRLNYAIDLRYGVLHDIAQAVWKGEEVNNTVGFFNAIWQGDANQIALLSLEQAASPCAYLNVTGPETLSVESVAKEFGRLFNKEVKFKCPVSGNRCYLSDASEMTRLYGNPSVPMSQMIRWQAQWIIDGGATLNKPTHYEVNTGKF